MKVSIVTVTYNCKSLIEETIKSVVSQTYNDIEYIVIDGVSTDGTVDVIKKYSSGISFFVSEPDKGIYDAMNKGIKHSTGEWIFFLNAGDVFFSENTVSEIFGRNLENVDAVIGDYYSKREKGLELMNVTRPFYSKHHKYLSMGFNHQCVFVRVNWAKELMFDLSFKCCADYNMLYTMYKSGAVFSHVGIPVTIIEGRYGFSQAHVNIQRYEEAKVRGIEKTISFKIYDMYKRIRAMIKRLLKRA